MKHIAIIGAGYVGTSIGVLISSKFDVKLFDIDESKISLLKKNKSHLHEHGIQEWLRNKKLKLTACSEFSDAVLNAELCIICTPTNFDAKANSFDTTSVSSSIRKILKINHAAKIIIKSTIPIGYTNKMIKKTGHKAISFSPEFLREGYSMQDNLHPARIIISNNHPPTAKRFAKIMNQLVISSAPNIIYMAPAEAETVKLFANTYLAMRVSYFNELDNFAMNKGLNSKNLIDGISSDPRIGDIYKNPSFGFGGYCLPKDLSQLQANFGKIDHPLIGSIHKSNNSRIKSIALDILSKKLKSIGFYRLAMKKGSDNFRESSVLKVMHHLVKSKKVKKIYLYEPALTEAPFKDVELVSSVKDFNKKSQLIICNRSEKIFPKRKIYTRDIYNSDL
jgi:UDPglucose 6-dehydrogenase